MKSLLIIASFVLLYIGIVLAAIEVYSIKPHVHYTSAYIKNQQLSEPGFTFSIKQIDSLSAAENYYFTIKNYVKQN